MDTHENQPRFEELTRYIETAPMTYLPALLMTVVRTCVAKKVFTPGGLEKIVAKARLQSEAAATLRKVETKEMTNP